jgi:hypothetical protein
MHLSKSASIGQATPLNLSSTKRGSKVIEVEGVFWGINYEPRTKNGTTNF